MTKWLRWLFWLAVLSGAGFAVWSALQRRNEQAAASPAATPAAPNAAPPASPPTASEPLASARIEVAGVPVAPQPATTATADTDAGQRWRKPVDGMCPDGFPIKVAKSGIYHVPGGRSYDRTVADRCYASADDAEADGYRRAKA
jgi:hypothetical protein